MNYKRFLGTASAALMIVIIVTLVLVSGAWAQSKYKTLYKFKGGKDGSQTHAGLVFDRAGNLYGTTYNGGAYEVGVVFKLTPKPDGSWRESVLHSFCPSCMDGELPVGGLIFDKAGNLYGTTPNGGADAGGTAFKLTPNADGSWTESVLYNFCLNFSCPDGEDSHAGLIFDKAGNLYGTTAYGGAYDRGVAFKLTPNADGSWTESVLYNFCSLTNCPDGWGSYAGLIIDKAGNLYGTTYYGGNLSCQFGDGCGVVFKLTPNGDGSWRESVLHSFCSLANCSDGEGPAAGLIFDKAGNLYGTTLASGAYGRGVVFKLTPKADGSWREKVLHRFTGGKDGGGSVGSLIFDRAGNLYGTTEASGAYGWGVVFKLTLGSDGKWGEVVLHAFNNNPGAYPRAGLIFDAAGNLFGTTQGFEMELEGDVTTFGSVFEITP
jgi:uncharacterized repeat protein (TIGR03803 family)